MKPTGMLVPGAGRRQLRWASAFVGLALLLATSVASAQIAFVGAAATTGVSSGSGSIDLAQPAGVVAGDLMVAQVVVAGGSLVTINAPPDWTLLRRDNNGTDIAQAVYFKVAGATEPAFYSWSFGGWVVRSAGGIVAYSGVDISAPVSDHGGLSTGSSSTVPAPSVNAPAGGRVIGLFANGNGNNDFFAPADMAARFGGGTGAGPNGVSIGAADLEQPTAGASGVKQGLLSSTAGPRVGATVVLNPGVTLSLDHIRIEHPGSAVTCEPASITLRACADSACSEAYPDPVTVTLSPAGGWSSNPVSFTGSTTLTLSVATPQTVTLGATASPTPDSATQCHAGGGQSCLLDFTDTGFVFSAIPVQIAGTASAAITLRAVRRSDDGTACTAALAGSHAIEFAAACVNPATCAGRQLAINGIAIGTTDAAAASAHTAVTLDFDANATANFVQSYPDVGAMQLAARYEVSTGATLAGTSNSFVVQPAGFTITGIRRSSDDSPNPAATDASGDRFIGAGQPFKAVVTAIASDGAATPNFGRESPAQGVQLTHALVAPLPGNASTLDGGSIAGAAFGGGVATVDDLAWHEVGIIRLTPAAAGGDYLGTGPVTGTVSDAIGRFVPDHFDVAVFDGCGVPPDGFTYGGSVVGQPFMVAVTARNSGGATTGNYATDWARDTTLSQVSGIAGSLSNATIDAVDFSAGLGSSSTVSFAFDSVPQPPAALTLRAIDGDGVSSEGATEGSTELRSGRLRIGNAVGSDQSSLALPLRVESWQDVDPPNAAYAWNIESADDCTMLVAANFTVSGVASITDVSFSGGSGSATLQPTGHGNADVTAVLGVLAPWLQFDWDGDGSPQDPTGRAGFGLNPGNPQQIYRREVIGGL